MTINDRLALLVTYLNGVAAQLPPAHRDILMPLIQAQLNAINEELKPKDATNG